MRPNRQSTPSNRSPTNVTLPQSLLRDARELKINISQACERGLSAAVAEAKTQRWLQENRPAMNTWNDHVEKHGLPLDRFRQF